MWEWWWDGQGDDIRDLVLCGTENEIDVLGNAGALDLQNQNIQSAPDPHSREYRPQFSPGEFCRFKKPFQALKLLSIASASDFNQVPSCALTKLI